MQVASQTIQVFVISAKNVRIEPVVGEVLEPLTVAVHQLNGATVVSKNSVDAKNHHF